MCVKLEFWHKKVIILHCIMIYMFIFSALGTLGATLLGASLSSLATKLKKGAFVFLQNLSVGGIIALLFLEIILEGINHFQLASNNEFLGALYSLLIILSVGLLFFGLHEITHKISHHHEHDKNDEELCDDHAHSTEVFHEKSLLSASLIFLLAISIHNIPEGLSLGITFFESQDVFPLNGLIMSIILFLHNLLVGFSMGSSFKNSGKSNKFSILITTLSAIPAYIFSIIGYFISTLSMNDLSLGIIFSISAGSLFYVLFIELLPQVFKQYKSKYSFIYVLLGILICGSLIFLHVH